MRPLYCITKNNYHIKIEYNNYWGIEMTKITLSFVFLFLTIAAHAVQEDDSSGYSSRAVRKAVFKKRKQHQRIRLSLRGPLTLIKL